MRDNSWKVRLSAVAMAVACSSWAAAQEKPAEPRDDRDRSEKAAAKDADPRRDDGIQGTIVRSTKDSVTVRTEEGGEKTYKLGDSSRLRIDGRDSRFDQLKAGQRLQFRLQDDRITDANLFRDDLPQDRSPGAIEGSAQPAVPRQANPQAQTQGAAEQSPVRLGVLLGPSTTTGARIHEVEPGSPAAQAGFRPGDYILKMNGRDITRPEDVGAILSEANREEALSVALWRNGQTTETQVNLGESRVAGFRGDPNQNDPNRPSQSQFDPNRRQQNRFTEGQFGSMARNNTQLPKAWLGIAFGGPNVPQPAGGVEPQRQGQGAVIRSVYPGSPAERAGLRVGDSLRRFNDADVMSGQQVTEAMQRLQPGAEVVLTIVRGGEEQELNVTVESREEFFRNTSR